MQLQEWQAKTFALHFCMPTFMLEKLDLPFDKRPAINKAAELFNLEYSFVEKRLALWEIQMMGIILNFNGNFKSKKDLMVLLIKVSLQGLS
ncbi:hypothetical protein RRU94_07150 [Domibacillus sp. DTU_2020_1001157_1_SI_ALB_TIR_016]|uniref:ImmA/IrrE family metallo-endopeptidase n=1 Tax=Domibacillus sp. DTU_2020_1001157_1_SI_ALB_TIR_016 TaxID=3077789 RepID=UPI0028E869D9|nr:ImmA/IrrE family metallo-endopeptidase [Domibacillus sp. DTU_2020_1001157_1_SI_ALB_TIR_016]WNS79165.1 hypothetical protein RRU94_07150 [Domibacillus sp. DTU_2020_1001157_1_SI_ALB_TIR_016]